MNTQEIIEGNKLIAEFMGLSYCTKHQYEGWYKNSEYNHRICDFYRLKYNSSWDWLMPVVEKIEGTKQADIIIHTKNLVQISYNKETKTYFSGSLLQNTWLACAEFIKWHNQNK